MNASSRLDTSQSAGGARRENVIGFNTANVDETLMVAHSLGSVISAGDVVCLEGALGAGKTQFVKGVAAGLGVERQIVSPTFNIVCEYSAPRVSLAHFDIYRLDSAEQLEDIDFYSYTDETSDFACVIEWANLFADEMPDDALWVCINSAGDSSRQFRVHAFQGRGLELLSRWCQTEALNKHYAFER